MQRRLSGQALRRLLGALRGCYSPAEAQLAPSTALANLPVTLSTQRSAWSSCTCTHGPALQAPGAVAQWQAARVRRSVLLSCKAVLYCCQEIVQPCRPVRNAVPGINSALVLCQDCHLSDGRPCCVYRQRGRRREDRRCLQLRQSRP